MAEFLRRSRIAKAISDKTVVYKSHVRAFWNTARYEESDKTIHALVKKKDENNKDIDVEVVFGVEDVRRILQLQDSDNDPTIMSERLAKGLWCRMGFSAHINGKMYKRSFSKAYRYLMHCLVHSLSHRKGAYDEVSDYIMNIVVSVVLNKKYNISQVIFEFLKENCQAGKDKYIMYPRFIMMILNEKVKDLPKDSNDVMEFSDVNKTAILRVTKDNDAKTKELICAIKDKAYVAPENDKWRHDDSSSDNEDNQMNEMIEKKTRWWCVRDGKRKRTPKSTPVVVIKETEKGSSGEPQRRLVDEPVIEPRDVIDQSAGINETLESYFKRHEEAASNQAQKSNVQEDETRKSSSDEDSEETLSESELVAETVGKGKVQLKKRQLKKRKGSDDEDSPYNPEESQKNRKKRKAAPAGNIPRNVRAKKQTAESQQEREGKKKQDTVEKSPAAETSRDVIDQSAGINETLESYFKRHEEAASNQAQKSNVQEDETRKSSSDEDSEETLSESELVAETVGKGKVQLKKRQLKKRKGSDDEDSPYNPEESQKNRKKRKAAPAGNIPRNVRAKKQTAESQQEREGKKKQDTVEKSPAAETSKETSTAEILKETRTTDDDYVEITGVKFASQTSDLHDAPGSSQLKTDPFNLDFEGFGDATGNFFYDMPEGEGDMFHDQIVKDLVEKVKVLEKRK
ncbi:hypothetical protein HanLR1_Chr14g0545011 [Helianthus annuus]|nr:hypothetical protein HanLR1_Chr14g0545011 [Helianthus annuus]